MLPIKAMKIGGGLLDTQVMTTGAAGIAPNRARGFVSGGYGALVDGTCNFKAGALIIELDWSENGGGGLDFITFVLAGGLTNAGWTRMSIDGGVTNNVNSFLRSAAAFVSGVNTSWTWNALGLGVGGPFGAGGTNHTITWS